MAYPFCAYGAALDALSRIADSETGTAMAFPEAISIEDQQRALLEARGMRFKDVLTVEYEHI